MIHKAPLQFLIILMVMGFLFVLSSASTAQTTGRLLSNSEKSSTQTTLVQGDLESRHGEEMFDMKEELMVEIKRMDLESADYPGTGANYRHDPRTPPARA